jgi:hypothetical protein
MPPGTLAHTPETNAENTHTHPRAFSGVRFAPAASVFSVGESRLRFCWSRMRIEFVTFCAVFVGF